jgi:hypothetical protein
VGGETVTTVDGARTAGLEGHLRFFATLGAHGVEHFATGAAAEAATPEAAAVTAAAEGTLTATAAVGRISAAASARVTSRGATILATVGTPPGLVGEIF